METILRRIEARWHKNSRATFEQLNQIERVFGVNLPEDYRSFLLWSNGGEAKLRKSYLSLWPIEELPRLNEDYAVRRYIPGVLAIGSDGGSLCYALDYRTDSIEPVLVAVPFGDLDPASVVVLGQSFSEGVKYLDNEE